MKEKKKLIIITVIVLVMMIATIGLTYALFTYTEKGENNKLILGDIWMKYAESEGISLEGAMPGDDYSKYFEFTISGTNTYEEKDIWYDIILSNGDRPEGKAEVNRISDEYLRFKLVEIENEIEKVIFTDKRYGKLSNNRVYVSSIPKGTDNYEKTYRLYMTLSDDLSIGNTDNVVMKMEEFEQAFASVKVSVTGDFNEKQTGLTAVEKLVPTVGSGGLVAINTNGDLYDETDTTQEIREYRYSGKGNYCVYSDGTNEYEYGVEANVCPETICLYSGGVFISAGDGDTWKKTDSSGNRSTCSSLNGTEIPLKDGIVEAVESDMKNYVWFNNEMWRIVGIFNGEMKLVKNTLLTNNEHPDTYTSDDRTFELKKPGETTKYSYFYFKLIEDGKPLNDWTNSVINLYLNDINGDSYYNIFLTESAKQMLATTTYYLGNVTQGNATKNVYIEERENVLCDSSVTSNTNNYGCDIWYGNQATWTGLIGLLYPSDYAYAASTTFWNTPLKNYHLEAIYNNWMSINGSDGNYFISPSSGLLSNSVLVVNSAGRVIGGLISKNFQSGVRPVVYLKSYITIISGDGSYQNPYQLSF